MNQPLLLDTGAWLHALRGDEPWAGAAEDAGELIIPGLVLAEVDYHLRAHRPQMHRLLAEVAEDGGPYRYEPPTVGDLLRALEVDRKFKTVGLGLVDASVVALAERLGIRRLLTIDSDFVAVRFGQGWRDHFELVVPPPARAAR